MRAFHFGNIMVKSWMMMEAVINGPTPNMTIERLESPPPENMFRKPKNWLDESNLAKLVGSTPGIGIAANRRKITRAATVKPILLRRIGSLRAVVNFIQKFCMIKPFGAVRG